MTINYKNTQWNDKKIILGESDINPEKPIQVLMGFHGADSTPENMLIHGNRLNLANTLFIYPEGPADAGEGLWSWWVDGPRQKETVRLFLDYATQMVDEARRYLKAVTLQDPEICMWGFSQGGAAALVYSLLGPHPLQKAASVCGFLPEIPEDSPKQTHNTSIYGIYGLNDEVIPSFLAEFALDELENQGYRLTKKETSQSHEVNAENLADLTRFFESG